MSNKKQFMGEKVELMARGNHYRIRLDKTGRPVRVCVLVLRKTIGWRYERKIWAEGEPMTTSADWALRAWRRSKKKGGA